jgi:uncharacterized membrane protein YgdD (TMEM256/DUF423 family)
MHPRFFLAAAAVSGLLAVALGAFGAHALKTRFEPLADGARRLEWWATAAQYHLIHALALGLVALTLLHHDSSAGRVGGYAFLGGMLLFSGSLYTMTLTGVRALGAITPLGGLAFMLGWGALLVVALRWPS